MHIEHKHTQMVSKQSTFIKSHVAIGGDIYIQVLTKFDSENETFTLHLIATPYSLITKRESKDGPFGNTLLSDETDKSFTFYRIKQEPLLSINRNFAAPVYIQHGVTSEDLSMFVGMQLINYIYSRNKFSYESVS